MNKTPGKVYVAVVLAFVAGAVAMRVWDERQTARAGLWPARNGDASSVRLLDMQQASVAPGVEEVKEKQEPQEVTIPSQLSKIELPGVERVISLSGAEYAPAGADTPGPDKVVDLQNVSYTRFPPAAEAAQEESKISMIEAPVDVRKIKSVEEYREFKRQARGSYPEADFKKEQVLVLESASNLPDKAFEIVTVSEQDGKRIVTYRVNVFGLDKKINTHSAAVVGKKDLPIEMKQVL